ncbi:MAG: 16S rRNA (cytosine(1402)-N(4))-methyltransferase RsmH [Synergistaceae bacterium]|jgi:16S rRNA (cytosine1402-N4)-methyltransferase|nr:16S rRNA (cytosine(1402)-N(4))-methyltransferase RsmH [Synergistaceae bacterium]
MAALDTHVPVMTREIIEIFEGQIRPNAEAVFVDATLGAGGHAKAVLERFPRASMTAFDQDADARALASENLSGHMGRVRIIPENFRDIGRLAEGADWHGASGILFDLGVSNMQLVTPERGFSFQDDGPLDMRMNRDDDSITAAELIATKDVSELARIFRDYGEERHAYRIAKAIARARERGESPAATGELTALIRRTLPAPVQRKMGTHPARRVFQALRIAVNSEMEALSEGLDGALATTGHMGVIVVISYHSLEDRIVKRRFLEWVGAGLGGVAAKRPITPSGEEIEANRSSRSAKLRAFIKGDTSDKRKKGRRPDLNESAVGKA